MTNATRSAAKATPEHWAKINKRNTKLLSRVIANRDLGQNPLGSLFSIGRVGWENTLAKPLMQA
jgi:hypothetical protein